MGLDMYAYAIPVNLAGDRQVDVKWPQEVAEDLAYWRKFNALHGWMEDLYRRKGGVAEFNCTTVRLMPEDIDALESAIKQKSLKPRSGFFFGGPEIYPEDIDDTRNFIVKARDKLAEGKAVFYDSWW